MSPRRNYPRRGRTTPTGPTRNPVGPVSGDERRETGPDGEWAVRRVSGAAATKSYRCPGCAQEIPAGTPHVVAWPVDTGGGVEERRHWHTACWERRLHRGVRHPRR
ncbi:ATP/GTP-binding protein [Lipingzhangella sp. LS1_29]|uniref:ATP/GTP-binding protein n=1 Tax=Lipingzhangella rawalii TaxID=2055835 RepID=A0ABU2H5C3_9ACTN|nr:ATP/GTP-binding protein [Lipingzhangella rawalii]MDS1270486.1 ATP/GTP-binding protein [Lipingzhangella rawalii]